MSDLIRIKRGQSTNLPELMQGEFGFCLDTEDLFIGGTNGNVPVSSRELMFQLGVSAKDRKYGAKGDGVTDDTEALQAWLDDFATHKQRLILPSGTYRITSPLVGPYGFDQPIILGAGWFHTTIDGSELGVDECCLELRGGSGQFSGGIIEGIRFEGNSASYGIEVDGVCGFHIRRCQFSAAKAGILFHNKTLGNFTEMVVAENCDFMAACKTAIEYKKGLGNASFHGSGMRGCTINQAPDETAPKVVIGNGCTPYNAPMSFTAWVRCATPVMRNNNMSLNNLIASFYGDITIEDFGSGYTIELADSSQNLIFQAGSLMTWGQKVIPGNLNFIERLQKNDDGSTNIQRKRYIREVPLVTGTTNILPVDNNVIAHVNLLVYGPNYEANYLLAAYCQPNSGSGSVTKLTTSHFFDVAGHGDSTFALANGQVSITNANFPASGVTAIMTVDPIGARFQSRMK